MDIRRLMDQPKAYSYLRFSTPEQAKGDSFRRQASLAQEYAIRHGLQLADLTFQDLGVSAYRGANAETGRLGDFKRAVEDGLVAPGSYLLVESLDRVSRLSPRKALRVLEDIVELGITVVTLNDGRAYSSEALDNDPMSLMLAIMTFIRANEESAIKGKRVRAAWNSKRQKALDKPLTSRVPAWITLDKATGKLELIPERAALVARIFDMLIAGAGKHRIAETFNREGIPTFGDNGTSRRAAMWHRSYINKIANNPAAMGTLVPRVYEYDEQGRKTRRALDPIPGYYPAAVTEETFRKVEALQQATSPRTKGSAPLRSLLAGLAKCPACGSTMTRVQKGGKKGGVPYLVCTKAKAKAGCEHVSVKQDRVEAALLDNLPFIVATMPSGDPELDSRLQEAEASLAGLHDMIDNVLDSISRRPSPILSDRLAELEQAKEEQEREIVAIIRRMEDQSSGVMEKRAEALLQAVEQEPLDVAGINASLRQLFDSVTVDYRTGSLEMNWKQGGQTTVAYDWPAEE